MNYKGPPLSPAPWLEVNSSTTLRVAWEQPFTWQPFPILSYQLTVFNSSSQNSTTYSLPGSQRSQVKTIERESIFCSQLDFQVTADNGEGVSEVGNVSGGFPVGELQHHNPTLFLCCVCVCFVS